MRLQALALVAAAGVLAACGTEDAPTGITPTGPFGLVRLVNAVPDVATVGPLNAVLEGVPFTAGLAYGAATAFQPVYTGPRTLRVRRTADTAAVVLDAAIDIPDKQARSIVAFGRAATGVASLTVNDSLAVLPTDSARVRVVHVSPSTSGVDVYITPATTAAITAVAPTLPGVAFRGVTRYANVAAGAYRVRVTAPGSKTVVADTSLTGTAAVALGSVRTVLVLDRANGGTPPILRVLTDR